MKPGWEVRPLGEVARIVNGGTPKSSISAYWNGDVPWMTPKEMGALNGASVSDTTRTISEEGLENSSARLVPRGSVILSTRAPIGYLAINEVPMAFNQGCRGLIPHSDLDTHYLRHFLDHSRQTLQGLGTGATFAELAAGVLKGFAIPLPPLEEQRRIVAVLDEAFEGLARARANIESNLADAGELRVKAIAAVMGDLEETSPNLLLKDIALDFGRGKSKHRPRNDPRLYGGEYPFIQTGDVRAADRYVHSHSQTYNDTGLAQSKLWPAGTVCVTIAANIAETATLTYPACFPDSVIGIVPKNETAIAEYIEYVLQYARLRLQARGRGAAQDNINLKTFETELFPFPSLAEQESVVRQLDEVHDHVGRVIEEGREQLIDLDALRQSLLARAFRGELT